MKYSLSVKKAKKKTNNIDSDKQEIYNALPSSLTPGDLWNQISLLVCRHHWLFYLVMSPSAVQSFVVLIRCVVSFFVLSLLHEIMGERVMHCE